MKKNYRRNIRRQKSVIFIFVRRTEKHERRLKIHNHPLLFPGQILTAKNAA